MLLYKKSVENENHAFSISIHLYKIYSDNSFVFRETATANAPGPI